MKTVRILTAVVGLVLVAFFSYSFISKKKQESKPNILWIMSDDHTANAISSYGLRYSDIIKTPNIDKLAQDGAMLNNCFVTNSICTPSRATILTGKYGHKTGVYTLWDDIREEDETVATLLHKNGYETAMIGKWHLHTEPQGFDYYSVLPGQGDYFDPIFKETGTKWTKANKGKKYEGYVTDIITDNSLKWLDKRENTEKPFFLMLHHKAPHGLWEYAPRHEKMFDGVEIPEPESLFENKEHRNNGSKSFGRDMVNLAGRMHNWKKNKEWPTGKMDTTNMSKEVAVKSAYQKYLKDYLRTVAAIDENVGRVLDYLKENDLDKNTIVVYTSDQGMFLGEHSYYDTRWIYDESLKMPFVIRKPDEIKAGTQCDDMITNLDFAELVLDYAGVEVPEDMQGRSFRSNLVGKTAKDWPTSMYYQYWMQFEPSEVPAHFGVRTHDYKLIFFYGRGLGLNGTTDTWKTPVGWELYDLKNDPFELKNLYGKEGYEQITKDLKVELKRLQEQYEVNIDEFPELKEVIADHWNLIN